MKILKYKIVELMNLPAFQYMDIKNKDMVKINFRTYLATNVTIIPKQF